MKKILIEIFKFGIRNADPYGLVIKHMELFNNKLYVRSKNKKFTVDLQNYNNVIVVGAGKASGKMAYAIEKVLKDKIDIGLVAVKSIYLKPFKKIKQIVAGHPVPNENSQRAALQIFDLVRNADKKTLVIGLISGGGSSLLCLPKDISLKSKIRLTEKYLKSGVDIFKLNRIRKKISLIKGGKLARLILPATSLNFILSDVVGDDISTIASGLTDYQDDRIKNIIVGNNSSGLKGCEQKAKKLGFETLVINKPITGPVNEAAEYFFNLAKNKMQKRKTFNRPLCIIAGGETTVKVRGSGSGGRCQEMVLGLLNMIRQSGSEFNRVSFLSCGTDGIDGLTQYAGAYFDDKILKKIKTIKWNMDKYLDNNDSNTALKKINALIKTGPTGTNVGDIHLLIIK
ncbi:MAG: hypothetical protein A2381_02670 [Bdellovibrionales bacterium RIFOXYB1_FULL_37_110]|nr:MAG: hypothetical protein A2181_05050 [Bdellovibrionales bacterium RIFOXYA1_FULL_38_20]OFZ52601.1 MAG: hypothetical protein A2417_01005 [Bdellovibrionales bacterium RIFOXYC1_FULL_37_79]OFZ58291.1 MAG: hypothetical protein A2381_02670 [Bdellovibrionales bacterium RIFOXYB1_FULL_37_110]OFZ65290.1 MAG: hypothetical protein A2577_04045 [Bdellovibrionales bacterium RIFOXYD1_FULL_36_51]